MSALGPLYVRVLAQGDFTYPWQEVIASFLEGNKAPLPQLKSLTSEIAHMELSTRPECFFFFRHLLMLTLMGAQMKIDLSSLFADARKNRMWTRYPYCRLAFALCSSLCGQEESIPPLSTEPMQLDLAAEYGIMMGLLGLLQRDMALQEASVERARAHLSTLDHQGFPFYSLWATEESCDPVSILSANYVWFMLCDCLTKEEHWKKVAERQLIHLIRLFHKRSAGVSLLPPLCMELVKELDPGLSSCMDRQSLSEASLMRKTVPGGSFVCTLTGHNSGMGAFHKDQVKVVNLGPWRAPLGSLSGFGIRHAFQKTGDRSDRFLSGWTRNFPSCEHQDLWIHTSIEPTQDGVQISVLPSFEADQGSLFFAFLLRSEKAFIGNHEFLPGTMRHYIGETGLVSFSSGQEKITISTDCRREVELIPLAGGTYFWGANFLLAYSIDSTSLSCLIS